MIETGQTNPQGLPEQPEAGFVPPLLVGSDNEENIPAIVSSQVTSTPLEVPAVTDEARRVFGVPAPETKPEEQK